MRVADKVAYQLERQPARIRPVECSACQVKVHPAQLEQHRERCAGAVLSKPWLRWADLMAVGITRPTLSRWCTTGKVRRRWSDGAWEYSQVDVRRAMELLISWHRRRNAARAA